MHLVENFGQKEPPVKLSPSHSQRILQVLKRASPEPIKRNRKSRNPNSVHN